ncbi:MAG TPA: hypothetical protein VKB76_11190 [Ktedonobacterales bacterium]|nr:hypothetical protein [Ktedonobacterales bacterium]
MDAEDAAPDAGDFSVCIGCASVLVFNDRFTVRKPTDAELAIALADKDVCRARQMIERMMGIKCD